MSERLRDYGSRGWLRPDLVRIGLAWHGDWLAVGRALGHARLERGPAERQAGCGDVMNAAARQRLRQAEAALGGRQAPWFRVAHHVVLLDQAAGQVAGQLEITPRAAMVILRLALGQLGGVYHLAKVA